MEEYLAISYINDFVYCPRSLYMHLAAGDVAPSSYQDAPQTRGKAVHDSIELKHFSNRKDILQNFNIFSEELGIQGKLDIYDKSTGELIERKAKIKRLYKGICLQLYAEYYCLIEMGYQPIKLSIYSMLDNKKYNVPLPTSEDQNCLKQVISEIQNFTVAKMLSHRCNNCDTNIYSALSW